MLSALLQLLIGSKRPLKVRLFFFFFSYSLLCLAQSVQISTSGYPLSAFYVPVANRASLQTALDTYKVIRLDANADYSVNGPSSITLHSNQQIYGLPGTTVPPVVIAAGTQQVLLSCLQTATVTFPASSLSTHDNLFLRIKANAIAQSATVENNLFLDWNGALYFDSTNSGHIRNNRFIRSLAHGGFNPYLRLKGNSQDASYGNVFLFYNFLTPPGDATDLSGLSDLTFVGVDAESWNFYGWGTKAVIKTSSDVDTLRFFVANGGDLVHNAGDPLATGYFDVGARNFLLYNDASSSAHQPKTTIGSSVENAAMINVPQNMLSGDLMQDSDSTYVYTGGKSGNSRLRDIAIGLTTNRQGVPWEAPIYETIPDPGGSKWNVDLSSKPDSTTYIQSLIDNNGIAFLPAGTYYISKPLRISSTRGLIGAGMASTLIIAKDPSIDMIVGDDHFTAPYSQAQLVLSDLTLQGGTNGLHHQPSGSGPGAQYSLMFLSHVTFRNMSNAGIFIDSIFAWDNNMIDHLNFVNCGEGLLQRVDPAYTGGDKGGMSYLDKNVFYHCQFVSNRVAVDLPAFRANNLNMWVENLFSSNTSAAFRMVDNVSSVIANSDFVNNSGAVVLSNDGNNVNVVSSRFTSGPGVKSVFSGGFSVEGSNFRLGRGGVGTIFGNGSSGVTSLYNSNSDDVPLGTISNGFLFNNRLFGSDLGVEGVVVQAGVRSFLLPTVVNTKPSAQLLVGTPLKIRY